MRNALNKTGAHVYYSIHGPQDVPAIANCWRTTGDISNNWASIVQRAVDNDRHAHAAGPGEIWFLFLKFPMTGNRLRFDSRSYHEMLLSLYWCAAAHCAWQRSMLTHHRGSMCIRCCRQLQ